MRVTEVSSANNNHNNPILNTPQSGIAAVTWVTNTTDQTLNTSENSLISSDNTSSRERVKSGLTVARKADSFHAPLQEKDAEIPPGTDALSDLVEFAKISPACRKKAIACFQNLDDSTKREELLKAIALDESQALEAVQLYIDSSTDPDFCYGFMIGNTPLEKAAKDGHVQVVELLLAFPGIEKRGDPLLSAVKGHHSKMMDFLHENPYYDNGNGRLSDTGMEVFQILPTTKECNEVVKMLVQKPGIKLGSASLLMTAEDGNIDICQTMLDAGIQYNEPDSDGNTALVKAASKGHTKFVQMLLKAEDLDVNSGIPLLYAKDDATFNILMSDPRTKVNDQKSQAEISLVMFALNCKDRVEEKGDYRECNSPPMDGPSLISPKFIEKKDLLSAATNEQIALIRDVVIDARKSIGYTDDTSAVSFRSPHWRLLIEKHNALYNLRKEFIDTTKYVY